MKAQSSNRRRMAVTGAFIALAAVLALLFRHSGVHAEGQQTALPFSRIAFSAPGRVEGADRTIEINSQVDGTLERVLALTGMQVRAGQPLALLDCKDRSAGVRQAAAQVESLRQQRIRLVRGSRDEQRNVAAAQLQLAEAVNVQAQRELVRAKELFAQGITSQRDLDQQTDAAHVADANLEQAHANQSDVDRQPLPEEVARLDADIAAAEYSFNLATESVKKCTIRSPINGTVLEVAMRPGEAVSVQFPRVIAKLADTSKTRIRAEVDERDVANCSIGQDVHFWTESGYEGDGKVVELANIMGKTTIDQHDPSAPRDRDAREVVIEVHRQDSHLVIGLRTVVQFLVKT
jgi:HlyD family secretion protein